MLSRIVSAMCTHNGEAGRAVRSRSHPAGRDSRPRPERRRSELERAAQPPEDPLHSLHSTARLIQLLRKDIFLTFR